MSHIHKSLRIAYIIHTSSHHFSKVSPLFVASSQLFIWYRILGWWHEICSWNTSNAVNIQWLLQSLTPLRMWKIAVLRYDEVSHSAVSEFKMLDATVSLTSAIDQYATYWILRTYSALNPRTIRKSFLFVDICTTQVRAKRSEWVLNI